jgi:hypothetical protein
MSAMLSTGVSVSSRDIGTFSMQKRTLNIITYISIHISCLIARPDNGTFSYCTKSGRDVAEKMRYAYSSIDTSGNAPA